MSVKQGFSSDANAAEAARALKKKIWQENISVVLFFASPQYDKHQLKDAINQEFAGINVIGCTTAGEITPEGYMEGTLTGVSFNGADFKVSTVLIRNLSAFGMESGNEIVHEALQSLGMSFPTVRSVPTQSFAMLMIDGMSKQEEVVVSSLNRFLDPIPLFGGSAGDGLNFGETWIFAEGEFHANAAVLTIFHTNCAFKVFKFDHFSPTDRKMVVTEADPNARLVTEINAEPAAPAYAKMVGLDTTQLSPLIFASYPVVVKIGGEYHVRSIQKVEDDGSLRFYCGIDEGLVLTVAQGGDMANNLDVALNGVKAQMGAVELILGFDCILRRLEAEQTQKTREVSNILKRHRVVGFSTYGEQFKSMHVNQTFTGVAIGPPRTRTTEQVAS
jgi:hypothetical protein